MSRKRRERHEGGVYQRGDGLWVGAASRGFDAAAKRVREVVYGATKTEAQEKLRELQNKKEKAAAAKKILLGELLDEWLEVARESGIEWSTWVRYRSHVRDHVKPRVGALKLCDLRPRVFSNLYRQMVAEGVSPALTYKVSVAMSLAMRYALEQDYLTGANPAREAKRPRVPKYRPTVYTAAQAVQFLKAVEGDRLEALYHLAIDSGCREGELFSVTWGDLDFASGRLSVTKALAEVGQRIWIKDKPKTEMSRRTVVLGFSLPALAAHKERMWTQGYDVSDRGLVFASPGGGFLRKSNFLQREFDPIFARCGLPKVRFHDLRHVCGTLLMAAGEATKIVSERLGHASAAFTAKVYQHVVEGMQAQAADRLKGVLEAVKASPDRAADSAENRLATKMATNQEISS
jgi:integrase